MANGPTTKLAVRQAISDAINRSLHQQHGLQRVCAGHQPGGADHAELQPGARPEPGQRRVPQPERRGGQEAS